MVILNLKKQVYFVNTMNPDLKILEPNKTVVFYSPIEGEDVLVRTGTVKDKCNFLHAVLHSYSSDYVNMEKRDRIKFVKQLRASMGGLIDINNWKNNYMLSQKIYLLNLEHLYQELYFWLENPNLSPVDDLSEIVGPISKRLDLYILLTKLIPMDTMINKIIFEITENSSNNSANSLSKIILKNIIGEFLEHPKIKKAKKEKIEYLTKKLESLANKISHKAQTMGFQKYISELENDSEKLNDFSYEFAQNRFNRNIVIIGEDRLPIKVYREPTKKKRKTILVLKLTEDHYEIIGRLLPDNYIQREFDFNDQLLENIKDHMEGKPVYCMNIKQKEVEDSEEDVQDDTQEKLEANAETEKKTYDDERCLFDSEDEDETEIVQNETL
jgi:hypothetical protein